MEGTCMVYVSLLAENMGNKYYVHIHRAEQNKFLFDKISTIYSNKSIQHISMDSLDPSLRLNRYITGTLVKMSWLHIICQSVKKQRDRQIRQPHHVGGIANCQNDNTLCHLGRESRQSDDPLPSVITNSFQLNCIHENAWMRWYKHKWSLHI